MPIALGLVTKFLMMQKSAIKFVFVGLFICFCSAGLRAQVIIDDLELLRMHNKVGSAYLQKPKIMFMQSRSNNILVKYNPVRLGFGAMMYFYQSIISPQLPSQCLYHPSCSQFSKGLIYEFGLVKGVFTTSDRLMRCNRLSALDIHPLQIDEKIQRVTETIDIYKTKP
jgi:uncharacterized protein